MRKFLIICAATLWVFCAKAQDQDADDYIMAPLSAPDLAPTFRGTFKLPTIQGNRSFRKSMQGVANFHLSYEHPFFNALVLGGGVGGSFYDINFNALPELTSGSFFSMGGYGQIGYEKYIHPRWFFSISQKFGYQVFRFKTENCASMGGSHEGSSLFTETVAGIYVHATERMSYGLLIGYQLHFFDFGPEWVCKTSFSGLTTEDYQGSGRVLQVGFGFATVLGKLK